MECCLCFDWYPLPQLQLSACCGLTAVCQQCLGDMVTSLVCPCELPLTIEQQGPTMPASTYQTLLADLLILKANLEQTTAIQALPLSDIMWQLDRKYPTLAYEHKVARKQALEVEYTQLLTSLNKNITLSQDTNKAYHTFVSRIITQGQTLLATEDTAITQWYATYATLKLEPVIVTPSNYTIAFYYEMVLPSIDHIGVILPVYDPVTRTGAMVTKDTIDLRLNGERHGRQQSLNQTKVTDEWFEHGVLQHQQKSNFKLSLYNINLQVWQYTVMTPIPYTVMLEYNTDEVLMLFYGAEKVNKYETGALSYIELYE